MEIKQPAFEAELLLQPLDMGSVVVVAAITRVMLEEQTSLSRGIASKRLDDVCDEVLDALISAAPRQLTVGSHLQHPQEKGITVAELAADRSFAKAIKVFAQQTKHLSNQKLRPRLQLVDTIDDLVAREGVLDERDAFPGLTPSHTALSPSGHIVTFKQQ